MKTHLTILICIAIAFLNACSSTKHSTPEFAKTIKSTGRFNIIDLPSDEKLIVFTDSKNPNAITGIGYHAPKASKIVLFRDYTDNLLLLSHPEEERFTLLSRTSDGKFVEADQQTYRTVRAIQ